MRSNLSLTRFQRLLLFGASAVWFLTAVLSVQRNYEDRWILDGVVWPFVGFIVVVLLVLWVEDDNRMVAVLCSLTAIVLLLVPALKYKQVYGQAIDSVVHYRMIYDMITTGEPTENIYRAIAGMHSWLAALGIMGSLSATGAIKLGFPLVGGTSPLLVYWICRRIRMQAEPTKYVICLSCLATYPFHNITGTGFTLVPLMLFLSCLLVRDYFCEKTSEAVLFTGLALLGLVQLTIWHSTTPFILLIILVFVALTPTLVRSLVDRSQKIQINPRCLQMAFLAGIFILGYHTIETDPVFRVLFTRLYQLIISENNPSDIIPASVFKLSLFEAGQVYLVMYGREALMFVLSILGAISVWRWRKRLGNTIYAYAFWAMTVVTFIAAIPLNFVGLDFRRLIWIPLAISPFFAGFFVWRWSQNWTSRGRFMRWFTKMAGFALALAAVCIFVLEFYTYQPLVPKSKYLSPDTPDEYAVWLHQVNSAYQQRMITFAENYSSPGMRFDIDVLGNRQYTRYYGSFNDRGLYMPLMPKTGFVTFLAPKDRLFLLHWPGKAGGYGEQVRYRSTRYLTQLRDFSGWGLIYDNGESFILEVPGYEPK